LALIGVAPVFARTKFAQVCPCGQGDKMELALNKEIITDKTICRAMGILTFVILTCLGAFVRIPLPFTPVPLTLQTFFVLLSAVCLGGSLAAISQSSYLFLGLLGLPVFTGAGSGLLYLSGPTGGYILGFILSAYLLGKFIKYIGDSLFFNFASIFIASMIILFCGVIWLKLILGFPLKRLLVIGFLPFLPGDLIKSLAVSLIYCKLKSRIRQVF
jgi:biotin transport system substrate-specific component